MTPFRKAGSDAFNPGLLWRIPAMPRKVVLLRASRIGDFINTIPAINAVRSALPEAEISLITLPILKELVLRCPDIDRYIPFPGFPGIAEQLFSPQSALEFFSGMQAEHFDLAIQMQGSGVNSNPFLHLLGAKYEAGFIRPNDTPGLLKAALSLPDQGHEIDRMLALTSFLGAPPVTRHPEFSLWDEDHYAADDLLSDFQPPWFGIHTMARDPSRRWPLNRFVSVAKRLQYRYGGTIIVIGKNEERDTVSAALSAQGLNFQNLAGLTSLPVTGAVLARLQLFITNDTGPAHIAYAVGTPTITIVGSADPVRYSPLNTDFTRQVIHAIPCRPCGYADCPIGTPCLMEITVDQVIESAEEVLSLKANILPFSMAAKD